MEFAVNIETVVQSVLIAAIVWHVKSTRDLVSMVKLHDWRIEKLEEKVEQGG